MHLSSSGPATNIRTPSQLHFRRASKSSAERQKAQRRATPEGDRGSREPSSAPTQHTTPTHRVRCSLHQLHCIQKYERERERVCVCVCVCERERERERERKILAVSLIYLSSPLCIGYSALHQKPYALTRTARRWPKRTPSRWLASPQARACAPTPAAPPPPPCALSAPPGTLPEAVFNSHSACHRSAALRK